MVVAEVLNQVENLGDISTPAMVVEAYRVFEVFLRNVLRRLAPDVAVAWPSVTLADHAVEYGLLTAEQGEVLRQLREIRNDCSRVGRLGVQLSQALSHRYVTALREMICTIDKRAKEISRTARKSSRAM
jgi:hypothetical protein